MFFTLPLSDFSYISRWQCDRYYLSVLHLLAKTAHLPEKPGATVIAYAIYIHRVCNADDEVTNYSLTRGTSWNDRKGVMDRL
jgi:hypothetical protein